MEPTAYQLSGDHLAFVDNMVSLRTNEGFTDVAILPVLRELESMDILTCDSDTYNALWTGLPFIQCIENDKVSWTS